MGYFFFMAVDVVSGCNGVRPYPLFYDLYVSLMKTTTFVIKMLTKYQLCETSELLRGGGCRFGEILVFQIKIRIVLLAFPLLTVCKYSQGIFFLWIRLSVINLPSKCHFHWKILSFFTVMVYQAFNKLFKKNIFLILMFFALLFT